MPAEGNRLAGPSLLRLAGNRRGRRSAQTTGVGWSAPGAPTGRPKPQHLPPRCQPRASFHAQRSPAVMRPGLPKKCRPAPRQRDSVSARTARAGARPFRAHNSEDQDHRPWRHRPGCAKACQAGAACLRGFVMPFADRTDAGRRLAVRVEHLRHEQVVVLGLPRGGVSVALHAARHLARRLMSSSCASSACRSSLNYGWVR
jgi:hypothetical protein